MPALTQRISTWRCSNGTRGEALGGICISRSAEPISSRKCDSLALPGSAAPPSRNSFRVFNEKPPLASSPPWHFTQWARRIGTTSWTKSTVSAETMQQLMQKVHARILAETRDRELTCFMTLPQSSQRSCHADTACPCQKSFPNPQASGFHQGRVCNK